MNQNNSTMKIAKALQVTTEYLVQGTNSETEKLNSDTNYMIKMYKKYYKLLTNLEKLSKPKQDIIENLANVLVEEHQ